MNENYFKLTEGFPYILLIKKVSKSMHVQMDTKPVTKRVQT